MKIAFTTSSLNGYGLNRIFEIGKELSFDGIELVMDKKNYDTLSAEYINSLSKTYNLPVLAIEAFDNAKEKHIRDAVDIAKTIGSKIVIVKPPKFFDFKYSQWLKDEVPKIREQEEISIALENSPGETILGFIPAHAMNSLHDLKKFKHACLNTGYTFEKKENLIDTFLKIKNYLVHVHLSNVKKGKVGAPPQSGVLPIESFLSKLKQENYKGTVSIDLDPKYLHLGNNQEMKKLLLEAKDFCLQYIVG